MSTKSDSLKGKLTENFSEFSRLSDYSFINSLKADPQSTKDGNDHKPRSVYSGHYVPVVPTAIPEPEYISHSNKLFKELRLSSDLTKDKNFCRFFSGDISVANYPMSPVGWATAMHYQFTELNIPNNVPLVLAMVMAMVEQFLFLKVYSMGKEWKCNLKEQVKLPTVGVQMAGLS